MQFTLKQEDLCGVVGKLKPFIRRTGAYAHQVENGLLFEAKGDQITVSAFNGANLATAVPGVISKKGQVVLDLKGLEYFTRRQFANQTVSFKVTTKTVEKYGQKTKETQCQAQAEETRLHIDALHSRLFGDAEKFLMAKEYRPACTVDAGQMARALKRVSAYISSQTYSSSHSSNELRIESTKKNQLTMMGYGANTLGVETVACTTKGEVPRLALRPDGFQPLISALEGFAPPPPRVSLGVPEARETLVTFEVDPTGERWRVQHGGDTVCFANVTAHWPDYQSIIPTKGRKLALLRKALVKALGELPKDAATIVTLSQKQGKPAVFEWVNNRRIDRLALEIPGLPPLRPMDLNRKLVGKVLKSFLGDTVTLLIPPEPTRPFRFTCADDPCFTVCLARIIREKPAQVQAPPAQPEPDPVEAEPEPAEVQS
jgi:hypothetical protein